MGEMKKRAEGAGATRVLVDWVDRALLISLLRQTTGTGIAHQKSLNRVLGALRDRHDWSYLEGERANPFVVPEEQPPHEVIELTVETVDFLLREVFEKVALRGVVAEKLFGVLEDLEAIKAGRYELSPDQGLAPAAGVS